MLVSTLIPTGNKDPHAEQLWVFLVVTIFWFMKAILAPVKAFFPLVLPAVQGVWQVVSLAPALGVVHFKTGWPSPGTAVGISDKNLHLALIRHEDLSDGLAHWNADQAQLLTRAPLMWVAGKIETFEQASQVNIWWILSQSPGRCRQFRSLPGVFAT